MVYNKGGCCCCPKTWQYSCISIIYLYHSLGLVIVLLSLYQYQPFKILFEQYSTIALATEYQHNQANHHMAPLLSLHARNGYLRTCLITVSKC